MRNQFNRQLKMLHDELVTMGNLCEQAISSAVHGFAERDMGLTQKVFEVDDRIDQKEREIEHLCMQLLLQQQPVASDLREISSALKMISDMERIGDQASDIAEITKHISVKNDAVSTDIKTMAAEAVKMVTDSVNAFVNKDLELAFSVIKYDDVVDEWFIKIKNKLIKHLNDGTAGEYCIDLIMIAKYLERIGDHATNIAEWVEYSLTGKH